MSLRLSSPLNSVPGIGPKLALKLAEQNLDTLQDLLLFLPLRYEDRSQIKTIIEAKSLTEKQVISIEATVESVSQFSRPGRKMQTATISDDTGKLKLIWFNSPFILRSLKKNQTYVFSGNYDPKFKNISQATFEPLRTEMIHTGRIVPLYSGRLPIAQGTFRRILNNLFNKTKLEIAEDNKPNSIDKLIQSELPALTTALRQLHFPESETDVDLARRRLALEEFLSLISQSKKLKEEWQARKNAPKIFAKPEDVIPKDLPFELTQAQIRSIKEILEDLQSQVAMNRLLIGDVGSGKTVVAGCAAQAFLDMGISAAIVAPTKILAGQHLESIQKLFPQTDIVLLTQATNKIENSSKPTLYIGTHKVINQLEKLKPGLIIYDEQHRFGVSQRSASLSLDYTPHILTMTATPIPRSLMLTIFSHLKVSMLDEMPPGRKPIKTWLAGDKKRQDAYKWVSDKLRETGGQAIVVCPFIDPSDHDAFDKVAAAQVVFEELSTLNQKEKLSLELDLLHGRQKPSVQAEVIDKLYEGKTDMLITTPIVEVGVDLPKANIVIIESAERFGLASLHQLRGRVGRAGQQGYCILISSSQNQPTKERLTQFCKISTGKELAELDLQMRGSGDLFGTQQHGFDQLKYGSWTDAELIRLSQRVFEQLPPDWRPLFASPEEQEVVVLSN